MAGPKITLTKSPRKFRCELCEIRVTPAKVLVARPGREVKVENPNDILLCNVQPPLAKVGMGEVLRLEIGRVSRIYLETTGG